MTPICVVDTETTGVHPGRKVWEVAMIRRDDHGEQETSFMVQVDLAAADPFGLSVGRFYERHPLGRFLSGATMDESEDDRAVSPAQAAEKVALWTHGAHIVGAVPNFDTEVLGTLLREHGLIPAWHYHLIDVENLAVGFLAGRRFEWRSSTGEGEPDSANPWPAVLPPWNSDELSALVGVEPASEKDRHTALGDARWCLRLWDAITGGVS